MPISLDLAKAPNFYNSLSEKIPLATRVATCNGQASFREKVPVEYTIGKS